MKVDRLPELRSLGVEQSRGEADVSRLVGLWERRSCGIRKKITLSFAEYWPVQLQVLYSICLLIGGGLERRASSIIEAQTAVSSNEDMNDTMEEIESASWMYVAIVNMMRRAVVQSSELSKVIGIPSVNKLRNQWGRSRIDERDWVIYFGWTVCKPRLPSSPIDALWMCRGEKAELVRGLKPTFVLHSRINHLFTPTPSQIRFGYPTVFFTLKLSKVDQLSWRYTPKDAEPPPWAKCGHYLPK